MDEDAYLSRLQTTAGAVKREGRDVLLTHAAADAFTSALFGLRKAFFAASKVDQIGLPMDPKDAQELYDSLAKAINRPPTKLDLKERRWRPDYEWAIDVIEQMLLAMGVPMSELERPWPFYPVGEPDPRPRVMRDRSRLVAPGQPAVRPTVERGPGTFGRCTRAGRQLTG